MDMLRYNEKTMTVVDIDSTLLLSIIDLVIQSSFGRAGRRPQIIVELDALAALHLFLHE